VLCRRSRVDRVVEETADRDDAWRQRRDLCRVDSEALAGRCKSTD
jgi:hypothetical protein